MLRRRSLRFVQTLVRCYWLLLCLNVAITDSFGCAPCNPDNCAALNSTVCPHGTIYDGCCCMKCVKGPGEECGGIKLEVCGTGSRCIVEIEFGLFYSEYIQSTGTCRQNPQSTSTRPATLSRSTNLPATSTYSISPAVTVSPSTIVSLPSTTISPLASPSTSLSVSPSTLIHSTSFPVIHSTSLSSLPMLHSTIIPSSSISSYSSTTSSPSCSTVLASPTPTPAATPRPICRTPCNAEFCSDGRNRFCSATGIEFSSIVERGYCQRTSCKACRLHLSPDCPTCPDPVNKSCLRKFYLCIDTHYQRTDVILELSDPRARSARGQIICHVPKMPAGNAVVTMPSS